MCYAIDEIKEKNIPIALNYGIQSFSSFSSYKSFAARFLIPLNKQQQAAVQAVEGPVLLLAVPGSGKTTVLVTRLGYFHIFGNFRIF